MRKSFGDVRFFEEKVHSLSVAPDPLAIWNKKLEGLDSCLQKILWLCILLSPSSSLLEKKSDEES